MRPIFGALVFIFIIFINEIETADRPSKSKKKDAQSALVILEYLEKVEEMDAARKKGKEKVGSSSKADEEARNFARMLRRLDTTKSSSRVEENEAAYGTSRATRRTLVPKLKRQTAPNSEPNSRRASDKSNRLPTFKQAQDRSGGTAYGAQTNNNRRFPEPEPNFGFDSLSLYDNTASNVLGGTYIDNEGYHYPVPNHPSQSTGNYGHDYPLQPSGEILQSGSFSSSQSTQNHNRDLPPRPNYEIPSSAPSSQQQGFQDNQSGTYYASESPGINRWNAYLREKNSNQSKGSGAGRSSNYSYQE